MKKYLCLLSLLFSVSLNLSAQWKPAGDKIKTVWAEKVDPSSVLPEYPRPQVEREQWQNLNGLWEYAITSKGCAEPSSFDGDILVPFAVESSLSGVQKGITESEELWYKREFNIPTNWKGKSIILNFGAVDWEAEIYLNDVNIGSHKGGYTPFSFDITPYLSGLKNQKLVVRVWDPSNKGFQPHGKQSLTQRTIWYTPVSGIWQAVWLEPVEKQHITAIKSVSDIDNNTLNVTVNTSEIASKDIVTVELLDEGSVVATAKGISGRDMRLTVENPKLWSPDSPYLYTMNVKLSANNECVDNVKSYAAFRKISYAKDNDGHMRLQLNNKNCFHYGPLDQGWWPDGLYTAPTDEALRFDIIKTKEWGFNMIRKHVKVEPARWYYHCDKEGILVWQDMPSGELRGNTWDMTGYNGTDRERSQESKDNYYKEWKEIMDLCMSNPCVVVWVPFNEAWGQFDTKKVAEWTKNYDPSRVVNPASGGNHYTDCGDILDLHQYPAPKMYLHDASKVNVLGEYGGIGMPKEGHIWQEDKNWGYVQFKDNDAVTAEYVKYANILKKYVEMGFSAAVYTQTTDVEGEVNGLMTYDRKLIKINEESVRKVNQEVIDMVK